MEPPHSTLSVRRRTLAAAERLIFPSIFKEPFSSFGSFWYLYAFSGALSNRFYCCLANRLQSQKIRKLSCEFYALVRQVISDLKAWKNTCSVKVKNEILPWGYYSDLVFRNHGGVDVYPNRGITNQSCPQRLYGSLYTPWLVWIPFGNFNFILVVLHRIRSLDLPLTYS